VRETAIASDSDAYGGQWIENLNGGRLVVATTAAPMALLNDLQDLVPDPSDLSVVQVAFSLQELTDLQELISERAEQAGVDHAVIVDERNNRVKVVLRQPERVVLSDLPPDAWVISDEPLFADASTPSGTHSNPHPGLSIGVLPNTGNRSLGQRCTWGFNANLGANYYIVTAGHCADLYATGDKTWTQSDIIQNHSTSGNLITNNGTAYIRDDNRTDAMRITDNNDADDNCYHTSSSECYTITSRQLLNADQVGDIVCASLGGSSTYKCAELLSLSVTSNGISNLRQWDYGAVGGDSGAGMKHAHQARGLLVQSNGSTSLYTHIYYVVNRLGVTLNYS